jgi:hypothetical protein
MSWLPLVAWQPTANAALRMRQWRGLEALDVGGIAVPEAAATESLLTGLRRMHEGDDDFPAAAGVMFDGWYAAFSSAAEASDRSTT